LPGIPARPAAARRRELAVLFLVTLVATAPFVAQAFHVDDEVYLRLARELVRSPASFMARAEPLFGVQTPLVDHTQHPPLTVVFLALLTWLLGAPREVPFHIAYAGFTFLAVFGLYRLLGRWTTSAYQACLLIVVSPAFVVSSHTLMTDVPFLAFFTLALDSYLRLLEDGDSGVAIRAALLASLCAFTQLRGLLLPVLVLACAWAIGRLSRPLLVAAAAPFATMALYELAAQLLWGVSPLLHSAGFLETEMRRLLLATVTYLAALGGCYLFLVLVSLDRIPWRRLALALALGIVAVLTHRRQMDTLNLLVGIVFAAAGVLLVYDLVWNGIGAARALLRRGRETPSGASLPSLFGLIVLASLIALGLFACVRNLLVILPFVLVAFGTGTPEGLRGKRFALALGLTGALALACSLSDYAWAGSYRAHAKRYAGQANVYFAGEWGFRYYMEQAGARYLLVSRTDLPSGSLVVRPEIAAPENRVAPGLEARLKRLGTEETRSALPLVLMAQPERNCGWYSEGYGILPFCVGSMRQERFHRDVVRPGE
jgi:hypothetical protein